MIVYREFSSLTNDLGVSAKALYALSNHLTSHYHRVSIPKKNGETRELNVPDDFLKSVQKKICDKLLCYMEVSPYATAYKYGASTVKNARVHLGKRDVLKLDIRHFFDRIIYPLVKERAFPSEIYSENIRVLLSIICTYKDGLPQGAPTSPFISNIIMKDFDNKVGKWCEKKGICYTRYCDDMTFSGELDKEKIIRFVSRELKRMGFYLNKKKTVFLSDGRQKSVTGIVVNEKLNVPKCYRKDIRQTMYYCMNYGIESHLEKIGCPFSTEEFLVKMLGKINYVLSVDNDNEEMLKYKQFLTEFKKSKSRGIL